MLILNDLSVIQSQSYCQFNLELCCPAGGYSCGIRNSPFSNAPQPFGNQGKILLLNY